jgi:hypothetical protein
MKGEITDKWILREEIIKKHSPTVAMPFSAPSLDFGRVDFLGMRLVRRLRHSRLVAALFVDSEQAASPLGQKQERVRRIHHLSGGLAVPAGGRVRGAAR